MYTATINRKEDRGGVLEIFVDFSNGEKTYTESCKPQDRAGFNHWVASMLKSYNTSEELRLEDNVGQVITPVTTPEPTVAEQEKALWIKRDAIKEQVDKAIAKGYLTGTEPKVVQLNNWLKTNFKPGYLDLV